MHKEVVTDKAARVSRTEQAEAPVADLDVTEVDVYGDWEASEGCLADTEWRDDNAAA